MGLNSHHRNQTFSDLGEERWCRRSLSAAVPSCEEGVYSSLRTHSCISVDASTCRTHDLCLFCHMFCHMFSLLLLRGVCCCTSSACFVLQFSAHTPALRVAGHIHTPTPPLGTTASTCGRRPAVGWRQPPVASTPRARRCCRCRRWCPTPETAVLRGMKCDRPFRQSLGVDTKVHFAARPVAPKTVLRFTTRFFLRFTCRHPRFVM